MTENELERWRWRGRRENGVEMTQNDVKVDQFSELNLKALAKQGSLWKRKSRYGSQGGSITMMMMAKTEAELVV